MTVAELSYTQLDPSVLSELPQDLRDELAAMLPSSSRTAPHSKLANPLPAKSNPTAARLHLLENGRHLGNKTVLLQQQHDHVRPEPGQEEGVEKVIDEPATELWTELHLALEGLSAATKACFVTDTASNASNNSEDQQQAANNEKFEALVVVVLQWTSRQVECNLEGVNYLLRRLIGYAARPDMIQLGIARLVKGMQQRVKSAHGAKLQLLQPLV